MPDGEQRLQVTNNAEPDVVNIEPADRQSGDLMSMLEGEMERAKIEAPSFFATLQVD